MQYAIGIDYGTQSARLILVEVPSGKVVAESEQHYPHGVMEHALPSGKKLGENWAVQDANDYYEMIAAGTREVLAASGAAPQDVIGIGIDITCCTMLPLDAALEPLSNHAEFADEPNAYAKLWKHHAAQSYANKLNEIARAEGMAFLDRYGGIISSEWLIPKIMQVAEEAPAVYDAAAHFAEVGDWLTARLTGNLVKSNAMAGYKSLWSKTDGYPDSKFFALLHPRMEHVVREKLSAPIMDIGSRVGFLTEAAAQKLGLTTGTAVAVAHTDACVVPAGIGVNRVGQMAMSVGTSTCHLLLGEGMKHVPGICGAVENGTIPGFVSYEAGQAAVGDIFGWFVKNCVNSATEKAAEARGISVYELLEEQAGALAPGESGLVALDWFNGNRTILVDADLSGMIAGLTLHTTPAKIYRALMEATAFGTRIIIENFVRNGIPVNEIIACGGIPQKSPLLMQIYADVCGRPIQVSGLKLASAYSAAMYGAVAAGGSAGGFDSTAEAIDAMAWKDTRTYHPNSATAAAYDRLYAIFVKLHDFAGMHTDILRQLKQLSLDAAQ